MLPFASTVALGLNALSRKGGVVVDEEVLAFGVVPAVFGRAGAATGAVGDVVSMGAEITGPDVVAGAIVVDCDVAVSAGVAPLSLVVQPTTAASINPAIASFIVSFIVFRFG